MSLEAGKDAAQIIAFLHYPPVFGNTDAAELTGLLRAYGVRRCYYGHLHGKAIRYAVQGERGGVQYKLISGRRTGVLPVQIGDVGGKSASFGKNFCKDTGILAPYML